MSEACLVRTVLQGNQEAIKFFETLARCSQVMDDLVDGDRKVERGALQVMYWNLLIGIPRNAFYRANQAELLPVMTQVLVDWFDANDYEAEGDTDMLPVAYTLRDNLAQVLNACAYIVGGGAWALRQSRAIRDHVHDEPYNQYVKELFAGREETEGGKANG